MNLFALLNQAAQRFGDHGAVYHGRRCCCTWRELRGRALQLAGSIRQAYSAGARIAIASENRPEIVELLFGIWAAECVAVPINYRLHPREMAQILDDAEVSLVFASAAIATQLDHAYPVEAIDSEPYSCRLTGPAAVMPDTEPSTLAWLFYTSGTTGKSKGAMLSHRNLIAMTVAHLADMDTPDERCSLVHAAPMSHGSGLYIPAYVGRGARQVIPERGGFDPQEFLDLCEHHQVAAPFWPPPWCSG